VNLQHYFDLNVKISRNLKALPKFLNKYIQFLNFRLCKSSLLIFSYLIEAKGARLLGNTIAFPAWAISRGPFDVLQKASAGSENPLVRLTNLY
jgi:hypothetical protein